MSDADPTRAAARARPTARPVPGRRLPLALPSARLAARSAPRGAGEILGVAHTGSPEQAGACKRTLLITFRRDGTGVPTPVWAAPGDGVLYVRTERSSGKVKRLLRDERLLGAPCTLRGKPLGAPFEAHARVLEGGEEARAERALAEDYGLGRALFELAMDVLRVDMCYLQIAPGAWSGRPQAPTEAGRG